jgi:hypothetical protein
VRRTTCATMGSSPIKSDSKSTSMDLGLKQFRYGDGLTVVSKPQRTTTALFLPRAGATRRSRTTSDSRRRLRKLILTTISYSSFRTRLLWKTLRPLKAGPTIGDGNVKHYGINIPGHVPCEFYIYCERNTAIQ